MPKLQESSLTVKEKNTIEISVEEFTHLKDIQTRFEIIKNQIMHAEYCPIHTQIILGIENEYGKHEFKDL